MPENVRRKAESILEDTVLETTLSMLSPEDRESAINHIASILIVRPALMSS